MILQGLRYHKEHEWVRQEDKLARVGISDFAQESLGDIVYLEMPKIGTVVQYGSEITEIESTKTTSSLYAPVSGKIVAVNDTLKEKPALINQTPYGEGWIVVIEMTKPKEVEHLMTADEYEAFLQHQKH